jgi:hypothetical protein
VADPKQLDFAMKRRIVTIVEGPHHVMSRGQRVIAVQLTA